MNKDGLFVNDCHAEILARKSFIRYLYLDIKNNNASLFTKNDSTGLLSLKTTIRVHLYISEPPCGDSSLL